jgi:hypothetical protein
MTIFARKKWQFSPPSFSNLLISQRIYVDQKTVSFLHLRTLGIGYEMGVKKKQTFKRSSLGLLFVSILFVTGCQQPDSATAAAAAAGSASSSGSSGSSSGSTTTTTSSGVSAIQLITKGDSTGSFDLAAVPVSGGTTVRAARYYNLDGSTISTINMPTWLRESRVFLTSTRTSGGIPTYTGSNTPCAYFDDDTDNNPETTGFYTIDGYTGSTATTDIDQCAGTAASELGKLSIYVYMNRLFFNSTDRFQVIVKAKPLDSPNTSPTATSCVVGGYFDPSACSNVLYSVTMRTAPSAAAKPFYYLFPSAKSLDLLSESVLLPFNIDTSLTTISIDRVKGGAVFYGVTVIRLQ